MILDFFKNFHSISVQIHETKIDREKENLLSDEKINNYYI